MTGAPARDWRRRRERVHYVLEGGLSDPLSRVIEALLVACAMVSVAAVVLESDAALAARFGFEFVAVEIVCVTIFTLEYALRLWSAPEHTRWADLHPWRARWNVATTPLALIDLVSILPFYLAVVVPGDFRVLMALRLFRFFKLARYSPGMRSLIAALEAERRALVASAIILFGLVLVAAAAMHLAEHQAQPDKFGSIPDAMWWAVVTLTTVGYGDVVPVTLAGRIIAGFTMLMGLMMIALPIGIVSTAFSEEIHRREFVVTWAMVARVPLFARLSASEIAEIMTYLRARTLPAHTIVVRRGEPAHSMYFIAGGDVEIEAKAGRIELGEGQFFGEMALLRRTSRTVTVRTRTATKLLVLDAGDLRQIMERNPDIAQVIEATAQARAAAAEELDSADSFVGRTRSDDT